MLNFHIDFYNKQNARSIPIDIPSFASSKKAFLYKQSGKKSTNKGGVVGSMKLYCFGIILLRFLNMLMLLASIPLIGNRA